MRILFVCTGNTCRSPMAEAILKHQVPGAKVQSAGLFATSGQSPNEHAVNTSQREGVAINSWSQPVTEQLLLWADLVLVMTMEHKRSLILAYPDWQSKYFTLKEYVLSCDRSVWPERMQRQGAEPSKYSQAQQRPTDNEGLGSWQQDEADTSDTEADLFDYDISDPFGGSLDAYQQTFETLNDYIRALVERLYGNQT